MVPGGLWARLVQFKNKTPNNQVPNLLQLLTEVVCLLLGILQSGEKAHKNDGCVYSVFNYVTEALHNLSG